MKRLALVALAVLVLAACQDATKPELTTPGVSLAYEGAPVSTFTVNSTDDVDDGTCDATHCSLREAINAANGHAGTDMISFDIAPPGPKIITPVGVGFPAVSDVVIDGTTQPGFAGSPIIEINGSAAPGEPRRSTQGISIGGVGNATIRGLVITAFSGNGIFDGFSAGNNTIQGNYLFGNGFRGIEINSANNLIGGPSASDRNVISGNRAAGILLASQAKSNRVEGNYIGTDPTGTLAQPNGSGVAIRTDLGASDNIVGDLAPGAGNVISGNASSGIVIVGPGTGRNVVQGNLIGTHADGVGPLGNGLHGIDLAFSPDETLIRGNMLAFNAGAGVGVDGTGHAVLANSIFSNAGLGIDLVPGGVTLNDVGDGDTGANNLQNFPVLASATSGSSSITIAGDLNSAATTAFRVEFFANTVGDPSGHGEGETFIGATTVTTDGSGNASFSVTFATTVPAGQFITATATDPDNNTSEFSALVTVELPPFIAVEIDIKPGSDPNSINCNNEDVSIAVAILTTDDFDATTVDHATVTFEGASETHVAKKTGEPKRHEEDVDDDEDTDLVLHFRLGETGLTCDSEEGTLTGETFDGQAIEGADAVRMIDEGGGQA